MDKKISVLYVLGSMHNGGTEAFVMNFFREIDKERFSIDFLVVQGKEEYFRQEIEEEGGRIYHLSTLDDGKYGKNIREMNAFFKTHKYDIIHIHSCSMRFLVISSFYAKRNKAGVVIGHAHSVGESTGTLFDSIIRRALKLLASQMIDYGMACSSDSAQEKFSISLIESNRFKMVPNAIDTSKYVYSDTSRSRIRDQFGLSGKYVVGIVGRLEKWKNQAFLMNAVELANREREVYMLVIGDGELRHVLEEKAKTLKMEDKVCFTGSVSNAYEYYSAMDLFCLPSYAEGFPFVLVEAQANGLLCIISNEITKETDISGTSVFLNIDNPQAWANEIIRNRGKRLTHEEIQRVKEAYDIKYAVKELENTYIFVCAQR